MERVLVLFGLFQICNVVFFVCATLDFLPLKTRYLLLGFMLAFYNLKFCFISMDYSAVMGFMRCWKKRFKMYWYLVSIYLEICGQVDWIYSAYKAEKSEQVVLRHLSWYIFENMKSRKTSSFGGGQQNEGWKKYRKKLFICLKIQVNLDCVGWSLVLSITQKMTWKTFRSEQFLHTAPWKHRSLKAYWQFRMRKGVKCEGHFLL